MREKSGGNVFLTKEGENYFKQTIKLSQRREHKHSTYSSSQVWCLFEKSLQEIICKGCWLFYWYLLMEDKLLLFHLSELVWLVSSFVLLCTGKTISIWTQVQVSERKLTWKSLMGHFCLVRWEQPQCCSRVWQVVHLTRGSSGKGSGTWQNEREWS